MNLNLAKKREQIYSFNRLKHYLHGLWDLIQFNISIQLMLMISVSQIKMSTLVIVNSKVKLILKSLLTN